MNWAHERGLALLVAVLATLLVSALAAALLLTTSSETVIASGFRAARQAFYSAEAGAEWCVGDVSAPAADWPSILGGASPSGFVDGPPSGGRALGDGTSVDLAAIADANAGWHLYGYGRLDDLLPPSGRTSGFYLLVFVSPDGASADRMKIRSLAFGPRGARAAIEVLAIRTGAGVRVESWHAAD